MKKVIVCIMFLNTGLAFAGQHSGSGGNPPPAPAPIDPNSNPDFARWLREQIDLAIQQQNPKK